MRHSDGPEAAEAMADPAPCGIVTTKSEADTAAVDEPAVGRGTDARERGADTVRGCGCSESQKCARERVTDDSV